MGTSVLFARGIIAEVQRRGLDSDRLLRQCGIEEGRLGYVYEMLSVEETRRLIDAALEQTDDPALGLATAARAPLHLLQLITNMVLAQPTLRGAFDALRRYSGLLFDGPTWSLTECGATATVTCSPHVQLGAATRVCLDFALLIGVRLARQLLGDSVELTRVGFRHDAPPYADEYEVQFGCPVQFSEEHTSVSFPRHLLDLPQPHADRVVSRLLMESADRILGERGDSFTIAQRVRTMLRYEHGLNELRLDDVARRFGLSPRSLRRGLSEEGTSLTRLLDEARRTVSCEELRRPDSSIKDTAQRLGFSEPSAFHRAFRRWTGLTPLEYARFYRRAALEEPRVASGRAH